MKLHPEAKPDNQASVTAPGKQIFQLAAGGLLLVIHVSIFIRFFPNNNNLLGHDYAYLFPALLDGYFWFQANGIGEIPWFTPSFCGGSLVYPNVVRGFYTVPQFLTFIFNPLTAVRLNLVIFAFLGLWGSYLLFRKAFGLSWQVSLYGSGFFLFNGFFSHRMLIGHLDFCHFMLLPLIAYLLLKPLPEQKNERRLAATTGAVLCGLLLSAIVQSNFITLILPTMIAILIVGLIHCLLHGQAVMFLVRLGTACALGVLLSLSRLSAAIYTMDAFPRSAYKLPGAEGFLNATGLMLRNLVVSPAYDVSRFDALVNTQWFLDRHEWEFSITPIPFIIIVFGGLVLAVQKRSGAGLWGLNKAKGALIVSIGLLLILPAALNSYYPAWNAFIKQLPVIGNSSALIRWSLIYIPTVILISALVFEKACRQARSRSGLATLALFALITLNVCTDRSFYQAQPYNPVSVLQSYNRVKAGLWQPEIQQVAVYRDKQGRIRVPDYRNDTVTLGGSQMYCYEAIFGYQLEAFPFGKLHPGPVMDSEDGILNLKNPACFVWPAENACTPGDHFSAGSQTAATAFTRYRPFPFKMPKAQKTANWLNGLALLAAAGLLVAGPPFSAILRRRKRQF